MAEGGAALRGGKAAVARLGGVSPGFRLRGAQVFDVPFAFVDLDEAVALVEAVRIAVAQGAHAQRQALRVGLCQQALERAAAQAPGLDRWVQVQVVQAQAVAIRAQGEADAFSFQSSKSASDTAG